MLRIIAICFIIGFANQVQASEPTLKNLEIGKSRIVFSYPFHISSEALKPIHSGSNKLFPSSKTGNMSISNYTPCEYDKDGKLISHFCHYSTSEYNQSRKQNRFNNPLLYTSMPRMINFKTSVTFNLDKSPSLFYLSSANSIFSCAVAFFNTISTYNGPTTYHVPTFSIQRGEEFVITDISYEQGIGQLSIDGKTSNLDKSSNSTSNISIICGQPTRPDKETTDQMLETSLEIIERDFNGLIQFGK